ncbi:MAG: hypothetical protein AMJ62_13170 [Myxococcales bacterium SG8_38]|nr:MAG: hypothetical protein AMJ62_13170 [Myxococcales bacterium SG8_38]
MLRARLAAWLRPAAGTSEAFEERQAYHSDIRALEPEAWSSLAPSARGCDVERAMWLAGVTSHDFASVVDIALTPHRVTPVDDIVRLCQRRAVSCENEAAVLIEQLPGTSAGGPPPLPWHRQSVRKARKLHRAARAWDALARTLLSNRWTG